MGKLEFSNAERKLLIEAARLKGMSNGQIFKCAIIGVLGADNRKRIIIEWGELMGLEPSEALRTAQRAGLILTVRRPKVSEPKT